MFIFIQGNIYIYICLPVTEWFREKVWFHTRVWNIVSGKTLKVIIILVGKFVSYGTPVPSSATRIVYWPLWELGLSLQSNFSLFSANRYPSEDSQISLVKLFSWDAFWLTISPSTQELPNQRMYLLMLSDYQNIWQTPLFRWKKFSHNWCKSGQ